MYSASDFRRNMPNSTVHSGDVCRHKYDCELAAAAATYSRGPTYSDSTMSQYARNISSKDNIHYYGSTASNYGHDRSSVNKVLQSAHTGDRVVLRPHEASHIREGAIWLADHKHEFSQGFVNSAASLYANAYDQNGHKVVDRRTLRY
ncbi:unnamed protein product [Didymodactylos carnosus]|uniref:Uncharacterized protein n=1 Tax=Didymodactylos carnosus TaxID=1234261 RepID=A0A815BXJ1_9BILA|nr:unnamed protein product [Didymodactylos carnosus]CAF1275553.1 unnamed protein product [Didymodactylos carnosus]CAF3753080.1 unnamed protein product [Didymodactylos carnosus]CAF4066622.1 unnamed protein product [Didymodactylos carnosus]